jgi:hypothetical protein
LCGHKHKSRHGIVRLFVLCLIEGENAVADTADKESQAEALRKEKQPDKAPLVPKTWFGRIPMIVVCLSVLVLGGVAAAAYALPNFSIALPDFSRFAELFAQETASAPIPDPLVAMLKDIQSAQQQNTVALQENGADLRQNTAILQQSAATLEFLRQGFTAQQTDLKRLSNQLSSLRADSLQNAQAPLTTSSIPKARARVASRKRTSRLSKPVGPVSVGGAPLRLDPPARWGAISSAAW